MTESFFAVAKGSRLFSFDIIYYYLAKLLIPINLSIVPTTDRYVRNLIAWLIRYPRLRDIIDSVYFSYAVATAAFIIPMVIVLIQIFRTKKGFSITLFCIGWFFICLLSVANFTPQGSPIAERFLYIPSFGFCFLLAFIIYRVYGSKLIQKSHLQKLVVLLLLGILSFYGYNTYLRNKDWQDQITIWESALKINPNHLIGLNNLGVSYAKAGKTDKAITIFKKMLDENPDNKDVRYNYIIALMNTNNKEQTKIELAKFPKNSTFLESENLTLANIYTELKNYPKAIEHLKNYQLKKPKSEWVYYNLAIVYAFNNQITEAETAYKKAIESNPDFNQAYFNLGHLYETQKNYQEAITQYQKVVILDDKNIHAHYKLGILYFNQHDLKTAKIHFLKVQELDKSYEKVTSYLEQVK